MYGETIIADKTFKNVWLYFPSESFTFPSRIFKKPNAKMPESITCDYLVFCINTRSSLQSWEKSFDRTRFWGEYFDFNRNFGETFVMRSVVKLYSTKNICSVIKSRKTMWGEHVARMGETRNAYTILFLSTPEGKRPLGTISLGYQSNINTSQGSRVFCWFF